MTDHNDQQDTAFDRLRRADPAHTAKLDLFALRRATEARIADPAFVVIDPDQPEEGTPRPAGTGSPSAPSLSSAADDDAPSLSSPADDAPAGVPQRTSRRGWVVAAAIATMLAVGAGGYIAGTQRETPVFSSHGSDAAEVADEAQPEGPAPTDADQDWAGAPESLGTDGAEHDAQLLPVQFIDAGLPTQARQAEAWLVDTTGPEGDQAEPLTLGQYPVISAADAVHRLADPRFNTEVWPRLRAIAETAPDESITPEPGAALTWPVEPIRLVNAELTVGGYLQPDGSTLMAPLWLLIDDQGRTWPVLAVAEDALDFTIP